MASKFECEVRFLIQDIKVFEDKLSNLEAQVLYPYEFTDYYYIPNNDSWDHIEKNLRIRQWAYPKNATTIFFVKNEVVKDGSLEFKRALYQEGKVPLYSGDIEVCKSLLSDLGFKPWIEIVKKDSRLWEIKKHDFKTIAENIPGIGWTGELEFIGDDPKQAKDNIDKALKVLEIDESLISYKPISVIYAQKNNLINK